MITIVDYGAGNIGSIQNMLIKIGVVSLISSKKEDILKAGKLIIPGVGAFDYGMKNLQELDLIKPLNKKVLQDKTPVLGICLGAQLLGNNSEEGNLSGLGWINMNIIKFDSSNLPESYKIPNMGWNEINLIKNSSLFKNMYKNPRFYFVHSYFMRPENKENILATAKYGHNFTAAVEKNNIFGVQFHPEKSHKYGMKLLENFTKL